MCGVKSNIVSMSAGQQKEHILNFDREWKNVFEFPFTVV
jgi:hypothetical protein